MHFCLLNLRAASLARRLSLLVLMTLVCASAATAGDTELGQELFGEYCANCHGDDAEGLQGFSLSPDEFTERLEGITENMPDFAGFFDMEEIEAMYAYLDATHKADEQGAEE